MPLAALSPADDPLTAGLLADIMRDARPRHAEGVVADYIPALAGVPADRFGLAVELADGRSFQVGDAEAPFSIQSVCKVFMLAAAIERFGEAIFDRVGREPSGMGFNSLVLLEHEDGKPRNPLINPGAIVVADALTDVDADWPDRFVTLMRRLSGSDRVRVDETVAASEREHGDLNRAIAWFLRAKGNLRAHPDTALDAYFRACATEMTAVELARAGRFLIGATDASDTFCRKRDYRRRILAIMRLCGLYDAAGDFAYRVGLPAKSGVGGGILAVAPGRYSVAVWSPALDAKGNSVAGVRALELLTEAIGP